MKEHKDFTTRKGKEYISVTTAIGIINDEAQNQLRGLLGNKEYKACQDFGSENGTAFHDHSITIDQGWGDSIDYSELRPVVYENVFAFWEWRKKTVDKIIHIEKKLFSDKYLYCGTPDRVYILKGQTSADLIDFKTGKVLNMKKIRYQLSAYQEMLKESGVEVVNRIVLHFQNGKIKPIPLDRNTHNSDFRAFLYFKEGYLDYHSK